jgi:NDP-sugar pyrophosphorylase family protein
VRAWRIEATFADIGTPADYLSTSLEFAARGGAPFGAPAAGAQSTAPTGATLLVGRRVNVAPTARVTRTILWDDVDVSDDARLTECVVTDGVRVPAGARWTRRVVVPAGACEPGPADELVGDLLLCPLDR